MKRLGITCLLLLLTISTSVPIQLMGSSHSNIYAATFYGSGYSVFLGDVDTMFREGKLFGVRVSEGRLSEVVIATQHSISRITLEEELVPSISMDRALYEFSGYSLKVSIDPSVSLQTAVLQGHKILLHTLCLHSSFTLILTFFNGSAIRIDEANSSRLKPIIIAFRDTFLTLALHNASATVEVEVTEDGTRVLMRSHYSCLSLVGFAVNSLSEVLDVLGRLSLEKCYEYLEESRYIYSVYISMFPVIESSIKQLSDLYYNALYNRLNTMLYPHIYGLPAFDTLIAYWMSIDMVLPFNTTIARIVAQAVLNRMRPTTLREAFIYLELAKFIGDRDRIVEICSTVPHMAMVSGEALDLFIIDRVEGMCGEEMYSQSASPDTVGLSMVDMLALSRLEPVKIVRPVTLRDIKPTNPWGCLAFAEALRLDKPYVHEVLSAFPLTVLSYPCIDYAVLKSIAGIDIADNELRLKPSIPKMLDELGMRISIRGREVVIKYSGWGNRIKSIKLNGVYIDINSIPLDSLPHGTSTITIEMDSPAPIALEVTVLYNGVALEGRPIYMDVIGLGMRYSITSITDNMGRAVFTVPPDSLITILINSTEIGLVQLRTRVGEGDREIVIDLARDFSGSKELIERVSYLERRLQQLEYEVRRETLQPPSYVDKTNILFSSLSLLVSIVAIALAVTEIRKVMHGEKR